MNPWQAFWLGVLVGFIGTFIALMLVFCGGFYTEGDT